MKHIHQCNNYNIYRCLQSHTIHSFSIIYYFVTSFDPKHGSSSGHYTRTWMYTETRYHKVGDLLSFFLEISSLIVPSFCIQSCSYIMAWWWPMFKVATSCQVINDLKSVWRVWLSTLIYSTMNLSDSLLVLQFAAA